MYAKIGTHQVISVDPFGEEGQSEDGMEEERRWGKKEKSLQQNKNCQCNDVEYTCMMVFVYFYVYGFSLLTD